MKNVQYLVNLLIVFCVAYYSWTINILEGTIVQKVTVFFVLGFAVFNLIYIFLYSSKYNFDSWKIKQLTKDKRPIEFDRVDIEMDFDLYGSKDNAFLGYLLVFIAYHNDKKIDRKEIIGLIAVFEAIIDKSIKNKGLVAKEELYYCLDRVKKTLDGNNYDFKDILYFIRVLVYNIKKSSLLNINKKDQVNFKDLADSTMKIVFDFLVKNKKPSRNDFRILKVIKEELSYI